MRFSTVMLARRCGLAALLCVTVFCGTSPAADEDRVTLRIRFGLKDQEPTDWSGKLVVDSGSVESIRGWRWLQNDSADGNVWSVRTRRKNPQGTADRKRIAAGLKLPMTDNGILVTLQGCSETQSLRFETKPASVTFRLDQLPYGKSKWLADGNVVVQRVPAIEPLATTHADEDYPAAVTGKDGTVYVAYLAFTRGRDFQGQRERVATAESEPMPTPATPVRTIDAPGDLAYLAQPAGGEQLFLRILRDGSWSEPIGVTDGQNELYRPAIAVAGDGRVWVFYSAHLNVDENLDYGNWELHAAQLCGRRYGCIRPGEPQPGRRQRLHAGCGRRRQWKRLGHVGRLRGTATSTCSRRINKMGTSPHRPALASLMEMNGNRRSPPTPTETSPLPGTRSRKAITTFTWPWEARANG